MNLAPAEHSQRGPTQLTLSPQLVSELGDPRSTLRATAQRNGAVVIVRAGGEVDGSNEETWNRLVGEAVAVATRPGPFVVDVNDLDFMGCCAFAVLADAAEQCRRRGVELCLVSCNPGVARVVEACGLGGVLSLHPTADSALSTAVA